MMRHTYYSLFKTTRSTIKQRILGHTRTVDERLDAYPSARAYLYYTLFYSALFTLSGSLFGALLSTQHALTNTEGSTKCTTLKERTRINPLDLALLWSSQGAAAGFHIGSAPLRLPMQHIIWPLLRHLSEAWHEQHRVEINEQDSVLSLFTCEDHRETARRLA